MYTLGTDVVERVRARAYDKFPEETKAYFETLATPQKIDDLYHNDPRLQFDGITMGQFAVLEGDTEGETSAREARSRRETRSRREPRRPSDLPTNDEQSGESDGSSARSSGDTDPAEAKEGGNQGPLRRPVSLSPLTGITGVVSGKDGAQNGGDVSPLSPDVEVTEQRLSQISETFGNVRNYRSRSIFGRGVNAIVLPEG